MVIGPLEGSGRSRDFFLLTLGLNTEKKGMTNLKDGSKKTRKNLD